MRRHLMILLLSIAALSTASSSALAGEPEGDKPAASPEDDKKAEARRLFGEGVDQVKKFQWAEGLAAFEKSHALVPSANTSLNIGVCERALGRYVRARQSLRRALDENEKGGSVALSSSSVADANGYLAEIERLIVRATLTIKPSDALLSIDGRPLSPISSGDSASDKKVFAAGIAAPGPGAKVPSGSFEVVLDPGNHVFVLARRGFSDAVVNKTLSPGSKNEIVLELDKLPATLKVGSSVEGSIVRVGEIDVGPVPANVLRPAGKYQVVVSKDGYVPYETTLTVKPGEEAKIDAVMTEESLNVAEQWWFWTSIVAGLGTAATITYFAVRPEPDPPPYDGGSSGWVVRPTLIRF
jgi:hypothetical protein